MSLRIYVAGPYSARSAWIREQNIRAAEAVCLRLWQAGITALCPHTMARHFYGEVSESCAIAIDDDILSMCDAVQLVSGWPDSVGTRREIEIAKSLGIAVFEPQQIDECVEWAKDGRP